MLIDPPREFHDAIEALAHVFSNRVSEYIMGDIESVSVSSTSSSKNKSGENIAGGTPHGHRGGSQGMKRDTCFDRNYGTVCSWFSQHPKI